MSSQVAQRDAANEFYRLKQAPLERVIDPFSVRSMRPSEASCDLAQLPAPGAKGSGAQLHFSEMPNRPRSALALLDRHHLLVLLLLLLLLLLPPSPACMSTLVNSHLSHAPTFTPHPLRHLLPFHLLQNVLCSPPYLAASSPQPRCPRWRTTPRRMKSSSLCPCSWQYPSG